MRTKFSRADFVRDRARLNYRKRHHSSKPCLSQVKKAKAKHPDKGIQESAVQLVQAVTAAIPDQQQQQQQALPYPQTPDQDLLVKLQAEKEAIRNHLDTVSKAVDEHGRDLNYRAKAFDSLCKRVDDQEYRINAMEELVPAHENFLKNKFGVDYEECTEVVDSDKEASELTYPWLKNRDDPLAISASEKLELVQQWLGASQENLLSMMPPDQQPEVPSSALIGSKKIGSSNSTVSYITSISKLSHSMVSDGPVWNGPVWSFPIDRTTPGRSQLPEVIDLGQDDKPQQALQDQQLQDQFDYLFKDLPGVTPQQQQPPPQRNFSDLRLQVNSQPFPGSITPTQPPYDQQPQVHQLRAAPTQPHQLLLQQSVNMRDVAQQPPAQLLHIMQQRGITLAPAPGTQSHTQHSAPQQSAIPPNMAQSTAADRQVHFPQARHQQQAFHQPHNISHHPLNFPHQLQSAAAQGLRSSFPSAAPLPPQRPHVQQQRISLPPMPPTSASPAEYRPNGLLQQQQQQRAIPPQYQYQQQQQQRFMTSSPAQYHQGSGYPHHPDVLQLQQQQQYQQQNIAQQRASLAHAQSVSGNGFSHAAAPQSHGHAGQPGGVPFGGLYADAGLQQQQQQQQQIMLQKSRHQQEYRPSTQEQEHGG